MTVLCRLKLLTISVFALLGLFSCAGPTQRSFTIADSKSYEASLYRQNCAICHGPEGEGGALENGTKVPSLREGVFKFNTEDEIYKQICAGGNGMTPFRDILTERELNLMAKFVHDKLRTQQKQP